MGCQHCSGQDMSIITNLEKFQIHRIFIKRQVKQQSWQEAVSCSDVALSKADSRTLCTEPPAVTSTVLETCCPSLQGHVFVQLAKCICPTCKVYLSNKKIVIVQFQLPVCRYIQCNVLETCSHWNEVLSSSLKGNKFFLDLKLCTTLLVEGQDDAVQWEHWRVGSQFLWNPMDETDRQYFGPLLEIFTQRQFARNHLNIDQSKLPLYFLSLLTWLSTSTSSDDLVLVAAQYFWLQAIWCRRAGVHQGRHISGDLNKFNHIFLVLFAILFANIALSPDDP